MAAANLATTIAWRGFGLGTIFGFIANKSNFCSMGAVSDVVNMGDWGRMRAWLLAIAVAMIGTNLLSYPATSISRKPSTPATAFPGWLMSWAARSSASA